MKLIVDGRQRNAKMRAHTATHILHSILEKIFSQTKQAGSFVDEDYLRFDFQADSILSNIQIKNIEQQINKIIYDSKNVSSKEMNYDDAISLGAKAFFDEKYGSKVRVISIQEEDNTKSDFFSIELCGGTHVSNTKDIGAFVIIGQEAVASGIKRISAYTGPKVLEYIYEQKDILEKISTRLDVSIKQIPDKLEKFIKENSCMQENYNKLENKIIINEVLNLYSKSKQKDGNIILFINKDLLCYDFKIIVQEIKNQQNKNGNQCVIIYNEMGNYAIIGNNTKNADLIGKNIGLKGGGNKNIYQGKDEFIISYYILL